MTCGPPEVDNSQLSPPSDPSSPPLPPPLPLPLPLCSWAGGFQAILKEFEKQNTITAEKQEMVALYSRAGPRGMGFIGAKDHPGVCESYKGTLCGPLSNT